MKNEEDKWNESRKRDQELTRRLCSNESSVRVSSIGSFCHRLRVTYANKEASKFATFFISLVFIYL